MAARARSVMSMIALLSPHGVRTHHLLLALFFRRSTVTHSLKSTKFGSRSLMDRLSKGTKFGTLVIAEISELRHREYPWSAKTYIVNSKSFKCSLDAAKRASYRSANAIFGKIGRIVSEEVTL